MPARGLAQSGMSADAFAALISDKKNFQKSLDEFNKRKTAAEEAERKAQEADRVIAGKEDRLKAEMEAFHIAHKQHEQRVDEDIKAIAADRESLKVWEDDLADRAAQLDAVAIEQREEEKRFVAKLSALEDRAKLLDRREAEMNSRHTAQDDREAFLNQKEEKLHRDLLDLNQRLAGFDLSD